jgi:cell division protein FtsL
MKNNITTILTAVIVAVAVSVVFNTYFTTTAVENVEMTSLQKNNFVRIILMT